MCFGGLMLLLSLFMTLGCERPYGQAMPNDDAGALLMIELDVTNVGEELFPDGPTLQEEEWHPRMHPPGSLLVDSREQYWMVTSWSERRLVRSEDDLEEDGLRQNEAIFMSEVEEDCIWANPSEVWQPETSSWRPFFGPFEDEGLYMVDWEVGTRRSASAETIFSYGFSIDWVDGYDGPTDSWEALEEQDEPLRFRNGTFVRTDDGSYFLLLQGVAHPFESVRLLLEAGYRYVFLQEMSLTKLTEQASIGPPLTRAFFSVCPARNPAGHGDFDEDGTPFQFDCDDLDESRHPGATDSCDEVDQDCDGVIDEDC